MAIAKLKVYDILGTSGMLVFTFDKMVIGDTTEIVQIPLGIRRAAVTAVGSSGNFKIEVHITPTCVLTHDIIIGEVTQAAGKTRLTVEGPVGKGMWFKHVSGPSLVEVVLCVEEYGRV